MKEGIAFFDFDGTITTKDTLLEFIKFSKGRWHFYTGFLLNAPFLIAYKLKIISNQSAKERILVYFFRGMETTLFNKYCKDFVELKVPDMIRPDAIKEITKLIADGIEVVIVSASPENWVKLWARQYGSDCISTLLEVKNNKISGLIAGKNCFGEEKVRRLKEKYNLTDYNTIYAYGDSTGDKQMLRLASMEFYKPFREKSEDK